MWLVGLVGRRVLCDRRVPGVMLEHGAPDLVLTEGEGDPPEPERWIGVSDWPLVGITATEVVLDFPGDAVFSFDREGGRGRYWLRRALDDETFGHEATDAALPRWAALIGDRVLHASSVCGPLGAAIFCGSSGAGKSTIAAVLAGRGYEFLGDDTAVITGHGADLTVVPSGVSMRLYESSATLAFGTPTLGPVMADWSEKRLVDPTRNGVAVGRVARRLVALVALEWSDAPVLRPLDGGEAFTLLARHSFDLPDDSPGAGLALLERWSPLAAVLPAHVLERPADLQRIDEIVDLVATLIGPA